MLKYFNLSSSRIWKIVNLIQSSVLCPIKLRTKLLRLFGVNIDKSAMIAENVYLGSTNLVMEKGTGINVGSFIDGCASVFIEEYVRIGPYVKILTGTHKLRNSALRRWPNDPTTCKSVRIKRGSWLGIGCIILPGVTVAEGCVIGSGAVVTKDTEPHGFYTGVPATRLKDLPQNEELPSDLFNC